MHNRRDFLKAMAISSAGSAFLANMMLHNKVYAANDNSMQHTEGIPNRLTSFAVMDDIVALAMTSKLIPAHLNGYIYSDYHVEIPGNISRMGWLVRASKQDVLNVLQTEKKRAINQWKSMSDEQRSERRNEVLEKNFSIEAKAALMMGWFMAAGIREVLAPYWIQNNDDELAAYQDMYVLKEISAKNNQAKAPEMEELFLHMIPRAITRIHTFKPDDEDVLNWTVRISDWRDEEITKIKHFADAYARPDMDKLQKYVLDSGFYNPDDAVIKAARKGRRINLQAMGSPKSMYAKALVRGVEGLVEGSMYL